ncbi:MAG: hypothetical protein ACOVMP_00380 [Chthoniobacterales bacterium]
MIEYHVLWKGQRSGPYTEEEIIDMINAGSIGSLHTILENEAPTTLEDFVSRLTGRQEYESQFQQEEEAPSPESNYQPPPPPTPPAPNFPPIPPLPPFGQTSQGFGETAPGGILIYRGMRRIGEFSMSAIGPALEDGTLLPDDCVVEGLQHIPLTKIFPQLRADRAAPPPPRPKVAGAAAHEDFVYDLRVATTYRSFRAILKILSAIIIGFAVLGAVVGGIIGGLTIYQGQPPLGWGIIVGTLIYSGFIVATTILTREFFTIVADIGDCSIRKEFREN